MSLTNKDITDFLNVAVFQYDIAWLDIDSNLNKIVSLLERIDKNIDIVFLPEMFATGFIVLPGQEIKDSQQSFIDKVQKLADSYSVAITGSHPYFDNGKFYNRLFFFRPGANHDYYNKRHLFTFGGENLKYEKGSEKIIINYKGWKLMPQVCYDLRFPVWGRNDMGYDLLYYCANWPVDRKNAWDVLLNARAIENQCYVIGINRTGKDKRNIDYFGNSKIISANGDLLENAGDEEKIITAKLSKPKLTEFRKSFPVLNDIDPFIIEK